MAESEGPDRDLKRMTKARLIEELAGLRRRVAVLEAAEKERGDGLAAGRRSTREQELEDKAAVLQLALETMDQGISMMDANLVGIAFNRKFTELLDFPPELGRPGTPFDAFIRFNAERGEYGPGDVDRQVDERVERARKFEPHCFERTRPDGTVFEIRGNPAPGGGFVTTYTDITERKHAENALRESEERYRRLVEVSPDAIIVHCDGEIVFANPATVELLAAGDVSELIGRNPINLVHPDDRATAAERTRRVVEEGICAEQTEYRLIRLDGGIVDVELVSIPFSHHGKPAVQSVIRDITERKRAEAAQEELSNQFRVIAEATPVPLLVTRRSDGVILYANPRVGPALGLPEDDVVGRRMGDFYAEPGDRGVLLAALQDRGYVRDLDMNLRRADGTEIATVHSIQSLTFQSQPALLGAFHDVSERRQAERERKRAEERLHDAIESIGEGFAYFERDGRLAFRNENFCNQWPAIRDKIVPGMSFSEIAGMVWDHGYVKGVDLDKESWLVLRREQQASGAPVIRQTAPGIWIQMTEHPIRDGGFVQIITDISKTVAAEAELRTARDQAEYASRTKTEFLANMSHELRTPLNAINGFSEVMCQEMFGPLGNPRYRAYAEDILHSGTHLLSLINDILDLSKIEAGKMEFDEQEVDVAETVRACLRIVGERAREDDVEIVDKVPASGPGLIADRRALKQIVLNLLTNAVKFTPPGGRVTVRAGRAGDGCFVLTVSDTGIGIAESDIETVLTPFGQVDGSWTRKHQGTGLGLPMVKSLVEQHGGTLEIVSQPGIGTNVHARFPANRVVETSQPKVSCRPERGAA